MSCGGQPGCDVLIEGAVELLPGDGDGRAAGEVAGEGGAEVGQAGSQDAAVGLGEQDGNRTTVGGSTPCVMTLLGEGMPSSQARGHRRGRAEAQTLPCRRVRERFRCQVVVRFLVENSPDGLGHG